EYYISASMRMGMGMMDAQPDDPSGYAPTFYPGTPSIAEAQRLDVGVGADVSADLQLMPSRLTRVSGSVVQSDGKPASQGMVMLQLVGTATLGSMMNGGTTMVKPDGTFALPGVPPGNYAIVAMTNLMNDNPQNSTRESVSMTIVIGGQDLTDVHLV